MIGNTQSTAGQYKLSSTTSPATTWLTIGYIHIGTSKDTSQFACDCLRSWRLQHGRLLYLNATTILALCDGGGSNGSRHYIFKEDLQQLADELGIEIRIAHYPAPNTIQSSIAYFRTLPEPVREFFSQVSIWSSN
jgi:hypothetical protein